MAHLDPLLTSARQGLRALGYVEGRTIALEVRWAEGRPERISELVVELLRLEIDVLVVGTTQAALAAKKATQTIPIGGGIRSGWVRTGGEPVAPRGECDGVEAFQ